MWGKKGTERVENEHIGQGLRSVCRAGKHRGVGEKDARVAVICESYRRETRKKKKKKYDFRPYALSWHLKLQVKCMNYFEIM